MIIATNISRKWGLINSTQSCNAYLCNGRWWRLWRALFGYNNHITASCMALTERIVPRPKNISVNNAWSTRLYFDMSWSPMAVLFLQKGNQSNIFCHKWCKRFSWPIVDHETFHCEMKWLHRDICHNMFDWNDYPRASCLSQMIFSDAFSWIKHFLSWLKFDWNLFLRVQLIVTQYWIR